jgi:uncharacterized membrane protein
VFLFTLQNRLFFITNGFVTVSGISFILQDHSPGMIQRIQSLFLVAVVGLSVALVYLPLYFLPEGDGETRISYFMATNLSLAVLAILVALLAATAIFLYRNRPRQIRMTGLAQLLATTLAVLVFGFSDRITGNARAEFAYGAWLPVAQMVLLWLAVRFIRKDEQLVRAAERLR